MECSRIDSFLMPCGMLLGSIKKCTFNKNSSGQVWLDV